MDDSSDDNDGDEDVFEPSKAKGTSGRPSKRRKTRVESDDDDAFAAELEVLNDAIDEGKPNQTSILASTKLISSIR